MKKCSRCHIEKSLKEFTKDKYSKDGLFCYCRSCKKEYRKTYDNATKEQRKQHSREYYHNNKDKRKNYLKQNKEKLQHTRKQYILKNQDIIKRKRKERYSLQRTQQLEYSRKYYQENKEYCKEYARQYNKTHTKEKTLYNRQYFNNRTKEDLCFKIGVRLRSRLYVAIKSNQKSGSAVRDLGCTIEELKIYLENQFTEGMTWDNWGFGDDKWNIDHIIPLHMVNLTNREEFLRVCHYTNLRPMWQKDNLSRRYDDVNLGNIKEKQNETQPSYSNCSRQKDKSSKGSYRYLS